MSLALVMIDANNIRLRIKMIKMGVSIKKEEFGLRADTKIRWAHGLPLPKLNIREIC